MSPAGPLLIAAALLAGQSPDPPQQDFRGSRPPTGWLKLVGPNARQVVTAEDRGLRVQPPPNGPRSKGWGVGTPPGKVALAGDFEITGGFELLSADPAPTANPGAGIAL